MNYIWSKLGEVVKLVIIFTTLTLFFYGFITWAADKVEQYQRGDHPKGRAVKVVQFIEQEALLSVQEFKDRILFYYWYGEQINFIAGFNSFLWKTLGS